MAWRGAVSSGLILLLGAALGACTAFWGCQHLLVEQGKICSNWVEEVSSSTSVACAVRISSERRTLLGDLDASPRAQDSMDRQQDAA